MTNKVALGWLHTRIPCILLLPNSIKKKWKLHLMTQPTQWTPFLEEKKNNPNPKHLRNAGPYNFTPVKCWSSCLVLLLREAMQLLQTHAGKQCYQRHQVFVQEAVGCSHSLGIADVFTVLKGQTIFLFPCLLQGVLLNILIIRCGISLI